MKIISRGIDSAKKEQLATCGNCNTKIEFLPIEAKYISDQREGDFYQIDCPICHRSITKSARN